MRFTTVLLLLSCLSMLLSSLPSVSANKVEKSSKTASAPKPAASNSTVELNPDYEEENLYDSDIDSDDEEETAKRKDGKSKTNQALANQKKAPTHRNAIKFVKKHQLKITVAMILIAFRREITVFVLNKIRPEVYDPNTKTTTRKWKTFSITDILKIIVFVNVARQLQSSGRQGDSLLLAALLLGTRNPLLSSIISKALFQENSSYIPPLEQHYTFERINERYTKDCWALQKATKKTTGASPPSLSALSSLGHPPKENEKAYNQTVIVLDLTNLNTAPGRIDTLRDEVSFLIHQHHEKSVSYTDKEDDKDNNGRELEVVIHLESPGGSASDFALAAQQLLRLRQESGITVTVCVNKVAASGGYMVACASSPGKLLAAPFAVIGSIGVIGQAVNVQKALEGWGVKPIVVKAGREKAPVGLVGEVKPSGIKSIQTMVDETHSAFKRHVVTARPILQKNIDDVATGKVWMGYDALKVGLIDGLTTSDEYIQQRMKDGARILKLVKHYRKRWGSPPPTSGIETYESTFVGVIKSQIARLLSHFFGQINLLDSIEEQEEVSPWTAGMNLENLQACPDTSYECPPQL